MRHDSQTCHLASESPDLNHCTGMRIFSPCRSETMCHYRSLCVSIALKDGFRGAVLPIRTPSDIWFFQSSSKVDRETFVAPTRKNNSMLGKSRHDKPHC